MGEGTSGPQRAGWQRSRAHQRFLRAGQRTWLARAGGGGGRQVAGEEGRKGVFRAASRLGTRLGYLKRLDSISSRAVFCLFYFIYIFESKSESQRVRMLGGPKERIASRLPAEQGA